MSWWEECIALNLNIDIDLYASMNVAYKSESQFSIPLHEMSLKFENYWPKIEIDNDFMWQWVATSESKSCAHSWIKHAAHIKSLLHIVVLCRLFLFNGICYFWIIIIRIDEVGQIRANQHLWHDVNQFNWFSIWPQRKKCAQPTVKCASVNAGLLHTYLDQKCRQVVLPRRSS